MAVFPNALTGCWQGDSARTMTTLTAFDMMILLALALGLIVGFMRGFVQEILSLGALIAALFVLRYAHAPLSAALVSTVGDSAAPILAFTLIMAVIWGGGKFVAMRVGRRSRGSVIGPFDRLLGAGFGTLKALLILAAGFVLLMLAYDLVHGGRSARPEWLIESRTYPLMRASGEMLSGVVSERLSSGGGDSASAASSNSTSSNTASSNAASSSNSSQ